VCGVQQSEESEQQRIKGIQLKNCIVRSKGSKYVQYCVRDWCEGYEPGVLNVRVQSYLLRVILEIIASVLFSLLMVLFYL
jgi:hypothetical protein